MLALPRPRHPPTYYGLLLLDLSKLLSGVPPLLEAALNALYARLPQLDAELQLRLADWLGDDTPLGMPHFLGRSFRASQAGSVSRLLRLPSPPHTHTHTHTPPPPPAPPPPPTATRPPPTLPPSAAPLAAHAPSSLGAQRYTSRTSAIRCPRLAPSGPPSSARREGCARRAQRARQARRPTALSPSPPPSRGRTSCGCACCSTACCASPTTSAWPRPSPRSCCRYCRPSHKAASRGTKCARATSTPTRSRRSRQRCSASCAARSRTPR